MKSESCFSFAMASQPFGLNIELRIFVFRNKQYDIFLLQEFGACALFDLE